MNARALFLLPLLALACWPCPAEQGGSPTPAGTAAASQALAVPDGLEATLFAAEPLLSSPSDIDVDARGRVWVCEFHDDDGDLKADQRETLFSKIGTPQHDHSVHAFVVGPDGRWYFNFGNTGKAVHDKDGNPVTDRFGNVVNDSGKPWRQGMVFRCRPDGSDFEVVGHNFRNNYEVAVDSFGGLWQSDNDDDGNSGVRINFVMEYGCQTSCRRAPARRPLVPPERCLRGARWLADRGRLV